MCLNLSKTAQQNRHLKPHNKSTIRWKVGRIRKGRLHGLYQWFFYKTKAWNVADLFLKREDEAGFHVMVSRSRAEGVMDDMHFWGLVLMKIEVRGHLRSGHYGTFGLCETWREFRILKIYR